MAFPPARRRLLLLPVVTLLACGRVESVPAPGLSRLNLDDDLREFARELAHLGAASECPVDVETTQVAPGPWSKVTMRLTNAGRLPIVIQPTDLPWASRVPVALLAVSEKGHVLSRGWPIRDSAFLPPAVRLGPGEFVVGEVPIDFDLTEALREGPVRVVWAYQPVIDAACKPPLRVGLVVIPLGSQGLN